MGDIKKSFVVKIVKERVGDIFVSVASGSGTPEEKAKLFMQRSSKYISDIRKDLEKNPKIPGGRVDDAIFYIIAQSVVDTLKTTIGMSAHEKPVVQENKEATALTVPSNITPVEAGLIKLFRNFHPAGGDGMGKDYKSKQFLF